MDLISMRARSCRVKNWKALDEMPTESEVSQAMAKDMKKRGIAFVGPVITYSFLQAVGIVNDHMEDCEYR